MNDGRDDRVVVGDLIRLETARVRRANRWGVVLILFLCLLWGVAMMAIEAVVLAP